MAQDRPTLAELLEAVHEFLERDALPTLEGRTAFHARVAANLLAIAGREIEREGELASAEHQRLWRLLGRDAPLQELNAELARRIRDGSLDDRRDEVFEHVRETVRAKLEVANPKYLAADTGT